MTTKVIRWRLIIVLTILASITIAGFTGYFAWRRMYAVIAYYHDTERLREWIAANPTQLNSRPPRIIADPGGGRTPLGIAIEHNWAEGVEMLVKAGAAIHAPANELDDKPLEIAISWNATDAARMLLKLGVDPSIFNRLQHPLDQCIHGADYDNFYRIATLLIESGKVPKDHYAKTWKTIEMLTSFDQGVRLLHTMKKHGMDLGDLQVPDKVVPRDEPDTP